MGCQPDPSASRATPCGRVCVLEPLSWKYVRDTGGDIQWPVEDIVLGMEPEAWRGAQPPGAAGGRGPQSHRQSAGPGEAGLSFH